MAGSVLGGSSDIFLYYCMSRQRKVVASNSATSLTQGPLCDIFKNQRMRKLLILYYFFVVDVKAQTSVYHPFPDSGAVWHQERSVLISHSDYYNFVEEFSLGNDTIIGSFTYKKLNIVLLHELSVSYICFPSRPAIPVSYSGYIGGIRQDILSKRVYYLEGSSNVEYLLYDFSLSVNDTLPATFNNLDTLTVQSIDSIFDGSNWRKRFNLLNGSWSSSNSLIEGIGSTRGLLSDLDPWIQARAELHCFQENGNTLYQDTCPTGCDFIITNNQNLDRLNSLQVYPNPFSTYTTIKLNTDFTEGELRVFNSFGQLVRFEESKGSIIIVEKGSLVNGIYLFQLSNLKGLILNSKVIIE